MSSSLSSFERDSVNDLLHKLLQIEIEHATCRYFGRKEGSVRESKTYRQVLPGTVRNSVREAAALVID